MKPVARAALWSALSFFAGVVVWGAASVYAFDDYERAWGRGGSLQVISWVAAVVSFLVGLSAALGFRVARVRELARPRNLGLIVGVSIVCVLVLLGMAIPNDSELSGVRWILALSLLAFVLAVVVAQISARAGTHAT